jgi:G:T-mismatch repair DNA endonuclease (very short patch repair protein)
MVTSDFKRDMTRNQMLRNNPMSDPKKILKIKETKLERYGDATYNNPEKNMETMLSRHGVRYGVNLASSNGIGVSKLQRRYYEIIKKTYPDAILEHYLLDVQLSVDIYIPSIKKVIEVYGDYWHCHPNLFEESDYHTQLHLTAKQKWDIDLKRIQLIESAGYSTEVIWEFDINKKEITIT